MSTKKNEEAEEIIVQDRHHIRRIHPNDYSFDSLKDEVADPLDPSAPSPEELAEEAIRLKKEKTLLNTSEVAEALGIARDTVINWCNSGTFEASKPDGTHWKVSEAEVERVAAEKKLHLQRIRRDRKHLAEHHKPMTEETTGLVTVAQAAEYLDMQEGYVRTLNRDGVLPGIKVGDRWIMLESKGVHKHKAQMVDGRFSSKGYLHRIDLTKVKLTPELLQVIIDSTTELARLEVFALPEGVAAMEQAGLKPFRPREAGMYKKKESPLELPEDFAELLKRVREGETGIQ